MKEILKRLKNKVVIGQYISIIILIIGVLGIEINTITSWKILFDLILTILSNPFILFSILYNIFSGINNPTNKKGI